MVRTDYSFFEVSKKAAEDIHREKVKERQEEPTANE